MSKRFVTIWFRHLKTDWLSRQHPSIILQPVVLAGPDHGRMIITAANAPAEKLGIIPGQAVADARAVYPGLQVFDDKPGLSENLLTSFARSCIRFTPAVAIDLPDGLILDASGCAHLWGGEEAYITEISNRFKKAGYHVRIAMADTIASAWAIVRFGTEKAIIATGEQGCALLHLPTEALRLESAITERLNKLGLTTISRFINMPGSVLRRRFGPALLKRLDQALGHAMETFQPVFPVADYQERLTCLEPIATATGIEIALQRLLESLCSRLQKEEKGLRQAVFSCYRIDGHIEKIKAGTNRLSHNVSHLFALFSLSIERIEPALGIELFTLEALKVEDLSPLQEKLWEGVCGLGDNRFYELLDRVAGKFGENTIHRYLPDEHYWPERSIRRVATLQETATTNWRTDKPRPLRLLPRPEPIEVAAPVPDYPPMLFRYRNQLHTIKKADGPERIEREWWLEEGPHRDYYCVEDEDGHRYWLFRSGHYNGQTNHQWFIHGFFA